ncbi:MAG TPA: hypothetical protein VIM92_12255 [Rhodanobacteraceae bacterium]
MPTTFTCNLDAPGVRRAHAWSHTRRAWADRGSPGYLDAAQVTELEQAPQLKSESIAMALHGDGFDIRLDVPAHGIAAVRGEPRP